ncbi:MAG: DUF4159 domain-containing protein [Armatimonadetes bacterium]|nr:DUF4159 domain-containing protein [Armatimonadota bacterium]
MGMFRCAAVALLALWVPHLASAEPFAIGKLKYGGGGDWYSNPSSLRNLLAEVNKRTSIKAEPEERIVTLMDDGLADIPFLFITGHGNIRFTDEEARRLREYLLNGGFLLVDDNFGIDPSFRREVKRVFPNRPLEELPFSHPIYHCFYEFPKGLPKIHEHAGGPPHGYGIRDDAGRVVLFYSFNTDLSDGWESPEVHKDPPEAREAALKMGTNIVVYALTH